MDQPNDLLYGTTTWFKFNSSLVRSESKRRTLVCRWSIVLPFCSIGSTLGTFFVWKFLHRKTHWNWNEFFLVKKSVEKSFHAKNELSFTTRAAKIMPILAPAKTSHQWCRLSVIREIEQRHAYNRNMHWSVGNNNLLRSFGVRIWRYLKQGGTFALTSRQKKGRKVHIW